MKVVGLDLSLTSSGVATADGRLLTVPSEAGGFSVGERALRVARLRAQIEGYLGGVDMVVMEGPAYSRQQQSGHHLRAGLWWMVAVTARTMAGEVIEISPSALKKFATGSGRATKVDMCTAVHRHTGKYVSDDNQADAFWLRQVGLHILGDKSALKLPSPNINTLHKIVRGLEGDGQK